MGSTHTTSTTTARRAAAVTGVAAILGLAACAGTGGDDDAAASATAPAMDMAATAATDRPGDDAGFGVVGRSEAEATEAPAPAAPAPSPGEETTTLQPVGQQLAIAAHATMQTDDVRAAVERITTTVAARGGRVASADIDYASPTDDEEATSRATLVVAIPPGELAAVRSVLEDAGDVLSYDQLAEDVTDQLADLDTRIANQRASIERIRELYANAVDVDAVVRIEAELTSRETVLEQLLATQQQITDRVAMSTLTIDVTTAPVDEELPAAGGTGLGDALAAGWSAFAGGLFAIVLGLTAAMPFVLTLLVIAAVALWVRALNRRRGAPPARRDDEVTAEREPEPVPASRRE